MEQTPANGLNLRSVERVSRVPMDANSNHTLKICYYKKDNRDLGTGHIPGAAGSFAQTNAVLIVRWAEGGLFCAMYKDILQLEQELDEFLDDFGYQVVDLQITGRGSGRLFRLFLEHVDMSPVTIGDCGSVASQVRLLLESRGMYDRNSSLEVSSGGLDRVLKRDRDFERYLGQQVRVSFFSGPNKKSLIGELSSFNDDVLVITTREDGAAHAHQIERGRLSRVNLVPQLEI